MLAHADTLRAHGIERLFCVATSDPFSLAAWAEQVDPHGKIRFLSDGNLQFARALDLVSRCDALFLGLRSERYALTLSGGVIRSCRIEESILDFSCTAEMLELAA